jgi:uncharacterized protein (DUF697 family)
MPGRGGPLAGKSAFGALGAMRSFIGVVKEIDFDEVRDRAKDQPRIIVLGPQEDEARAAAERIFGVADAAGVEIRGANRSLTFDKLRYDAAIVTDTGNTGLFEDVKRNVGNDWKANVFEIRGGADGRSPEDALRLLMAESLPHLTPALGRHHDAFRAAATKAIIDETATANGKFALVSNIPAVVPIFGSFVAASADLIVLTKNQIMMCYKIAAVHGRDLDDQMGVIRELVPVVGVGFVWRTLAREAASFIPFAAGTIPKVVVAYAGTFSVGHAAEFYYRFGKKPSAAQFSEFRKMALETAKRRLPMLTQRNGGDTSDQETKPLPPPGDAYA